MFAARGRDGNRQALREVLRDRPRLAERGDDHFDLVCCQTLLIPHVELVAFAGLIAAGRKPQQS